MSTYPFDDDFQDDDPTDELPILTDVMLEEQADDTGPFRAAHDEAGRPQEDVDARNERLSALEAELKRLQQRWSDTEAKLSERDSELSRLRDELSDREAAIAAQRTALESSSEELRSQNSTVAELTSALAFERERAAGLERSSSELEDQIKGLEQKIVEIGKEQSISRESSNQATDDTTVVKLSDEVAALTQHIENRNAVWHEQAEKLAAQSTRIRELEIEVAQRLERQLEAEKMAENEAAGARAAREKLGDVLEDLKRSKPADAGPPMRQPAPPDVTAAADQAARLKRELAQTVFLQASHGDDAETLSRLAELEAAIVSLEDQMGSEHAEPQAPPSPEPAKLICLTAAEPTEYLLDKDTVTIGRSASCDVQIGTHYVSRQHARIIATDSGCLIEDLGSRNGVFVNAVKVERQDLVADDLVTVGDTQFSYQAPGEG